MRRFLKPILPVAVAATLLVSASGGAAAADADLAPIARTWPHDGIFGTFDRAAVQRGFQVYRATCQACHGVRYVAFRNLMDIGFSEAEATAIAAEYMVIDGPDDTGEMFERPARFADRFPPPYPNQAAARAAHGGAYPPDLSLITKARANGVNYMYSLMLGYHEPEEEPPPGLYYNAYFPGGLIAMPQPLYDGMVDYHDGTEATLSQMSADLTQFLHWAAEPTLEARKQTGIKVMLFLIALSALLYATKRKIWADVH
jgi:ubiquinol-cytochrome c reductase cytochrome c1 subunit